MKKLISLLLALVLCLGLTVSASAAGFDDPYFIIEGTTLVSYNGWDSEVVIPDGVTHIGDGAFTGRLFELRRVTIPDSVISIGARAFYGCYYLESVNIPDSVTSIGDEAFHGCPNLASITFPNSLMRIGAYAFTGCSKLTSVTIPASVLEIGKCAFRDCSSLTEVTVLNPDLTLEAYATSFEGTPWLENLRDLGLVDESYTDRVMKYTYECYNNLVAMDPELFLYSDYVCEGSYMTEEEYESLKQLALEITAGCTTAEEEIYAVAEYIAQTVYYDCDGGNDYWRPYDVLTYGVAVCEGYSRAFETMMQILEIPCAYVISPNHRWNLVYTGSRWMLVDTTWISQNTLIDGVKHKEEPLFEFWYDFDVEFIRTELVAHPIVGLPYQEEFGVLYGFPEYSNVTEFEIPDSITKIADNAFQYCYSLTDLVIPDSVTSIGKYAFTDCTSLVNITIPDSVTSIGTGAFNSCYSLESIVLPDSITAIPNEAFAWCSNLTDVSIPDSVTSIGADAFQNCTSLTSITIPRSVTEIGDYAFLGCYELTDVYYPGSKDEWQNISLDGSFLNNVRIHYNWDGENESDSGTCGNNGDNVKWNYSNRVLTVSGSGSMLNYLRNAAIDIYPPWYDWKVDIEKLVVEPGVTWISDTLYQCDSLKEVYIGEGLKWLGECTFSECPVLETVTLPKSLTEIGWGCFADCDNLKTIYYQGTEQEWNEIYGVEDLPSVTVVFAKDEPASEPETAPLAYASTQLVELDGKKIELQAYALKDENGNSTNYVKLRDIAMLLNGSAAQFEVGWDGSINLVTGKGYTANGTELKTPFSGDRVYSPGSSPLNINGVAADLDAFVLLDDDGNGYTYFKLRDLGRHLGFNVGWSAARGIFIETDKPYTDAD